MYLKRISATLALLAALTFQARAQFFITGDEPTRIQWRQVSSEHFNLIYPKGLDSLALEYGRELEMWRVPVGQSIHYLPGEYTRGKIPVVLHPFNSYANGSVAWAPKRMDLYTTPDAYPNAAMSWDRMLAIHESRHVAQMQLGLSGVLRPFNWFIGEMANGAAAGLYGHWSWLEGDAVVAETGLTNTGRGRTADFLNYYRISFDQGKMRNFDKWSRESFSVYRPNKYAFGYLMLSCFRYFYDDRDFMGNSWDHYAKRPYDIFNHFETKQIAGKHLRDAFQEVTDTLAVIWRAELDERAPFMPMEQVTKIRKKGYTEYSDLTVLGDDIFAVRESFYRSPHIVKIDTTGKVRYRQEAPSYRSPMRAVNDTIIWSETVTGPRWSLSNRSSIRFTKDAHRGGRSATRKGRFYNPAPSASGKYISASQYPDFGGTKLSLHDRNGKFVRSYSVPDSLQLVETAWIGDERIYATMISDNGIGIYEFRCDSIGAPTGCWNAVLDAQTSMIQSLGSTSDGKIMFTSDRTGENELYTMSPDGSEILQLTNTRYGAKYYQFSGDGRWLYYAADQLEGKPIFRTPVDSLPVKKVDFNEKYKYFLADNISRQEKEYEYESVDHDSVVFSEPKHYSKIFHSMNIHSWAPIYFDYDNIKNMSYDHYYELVSLGVSGLSQNKLGTLVTTGGYSAHKDPYDKSVWRHSAHLNVIYTGLYPVIEGSLDFNDRSAVDYGPLGYVVSTRTANNKTYKTASITMPGVSSDRRYLRGKVSVYVPLKWSKGGVLSGVIPKATYSISNDRYETGYAAWENGITYLKDRNVIAADRFLGYVPGKNVPSQTLQASVRGYVMTPTAEFAEYPQLGIGAEVGVINRIGLQTSKYFHPQENISFNKPTIYSYVYGYLPGFLPEQGLRLSAKYQHSLTDKGLFWTGALNLLPRGMSKNSILSQMACVKQADVACFTTDYAIPFSLGDLSILKGLLFMTSMTVTPHFDMMFNADGNLYSAGLSAVFHISGIAYITLPFQVGVTYSYNGGSAFDKYERSGVEIGHHFVGPVFSFSL